MKHRVTLYALTMPPSPVLYCEFKHRSEAWAWRDWARRELPCHARLSKTN
ncbi:hypothetical protein [Mesorhizobium sp.]|nr:hypothetical protein [Mesorhizobium sp.]